MESVNIYDLALQYWGIWVPLLLLAVGAAVAYFVYRRRRRRGKSDVDKYLASIRNYKSSIEYVDALIFGDYLEFKKVLPTEIEDFRHIRPRRFKNKKTYFLELIPEGGGLSGQTN